MDNEILDFEIYRKRKTNSALFYHIFWTIAPVLAGCILLVMSNDYSNLVLFIDKGDLCLTSTAFFASSHFLFKENKENSFVTKDIILSSICFPLIFIVGFLYAKAFQHSVNANESFNVCFLRIVSPCILLISMYTFYRALKVDYKKLTPPVDLKQEEKEEVNSIMDQLGNENAND